MIAQIENTKADTLLKDEQRRWEPWKAMGAAFEAGITTAVGLLALATRVLTHVAR